MCGADSVKRLLTRRFAFADWLTGFGWGGQPKGMYFSKLMGGYRTCPVSHMPVTPGASTVREARERGERETTGYEPVVWFWLCGCDVWS